MKSKITTMSKSRIEIKRRKPLSYGVAVMGVLSRIHR